jgi:hypothetical protein
MPNEDGISPGDKVLWLLATFVALALLLLTPKMGPRVSLLLLVIMFVCLPYPIFQLPTVKRASGFKKRILVSFFVLLGAVIVSAFGWYVWPQSVEEQQGFNVIFKTQIMDMNRSIAKSPFWLLYKGAYGDTISPVALLDFIEITSLYSYPVSISSYAVAVNTDTCGWVYLNPIDARGHILLLGINGVNAAPVLQTETEAYNYIWDKPIPAHETQFGMLIFDTKVACPLREGSPIQFKMDLTDSTGRNFSYTSPKMIARIDLTVGNSLGQEHVATLDVNGIFYNVSEAHRRIYSDPVPKTAIPKEEQGKATMFTGGKVGRFALQDGTFTGCLACDATLPPPASSE